MAIWLVRCGMHGDDEVRAREQSRVLAQWCPRIPLKPVGTIVGSAGPGG